MSSAVGCNGLMVLPPYVYKGDWRETKAHVSAIFRATSLPCMLYNNPVAYGTVRLVTAIRSLIGDRLAIFGCVDDAIVEGIAAGATGWIAGLVNAFPEESVALFDLAMASKHQQAFELYRWFLPLLRLDTLPKFVQLIKLAEERARVGSATVRPPRLKLEGAELAELTALIDDAIKHRPSLAGMR
jgi:dihydrodipicolinate synthase/N-acetylneuraminate lyase